MRRRTAVAFGILLALLLLEVVLRLLWTPPAGGYPEGLFVADDAAGFRLAPLFHARHKTADYDVTLATNAQGFRGPEVPTRSQAPGLRVLVLGDSFAFGHGVEAEQAFPARLEARLRAGGQPAVVVNAGVPGYGTHNAQALLESIAGDVEPDLVVLGFYAGNDFRNDHEAKFGRLVGRAGVLVTLLPGDSDLLATTKAWVATRCRTAQAIYVALAGKAGGEADAVRRLCEGLDWDQGFGTALTRVRWDPDATEAFARTQQAFERLADSCARRNLPLLVALLPSPFQYNDALWAIVVDKCRLAAGEFDLEKPHRVLREFLATRGIACVDVLPEFERVTKESGQQLSIDVHFNAAGHELAAGVIADALAQAKVPAKAR